MPVQAFVDDSGGKGHSRHFVLAGLIGYADDWDEFSDEWSACLKEPPAIPAFKMKDAAGCTGHFYGMSEQQRDSKLVGLARIINRHAQIVTHSIIDLDAHRKTWAKLDKPRNEPYFWTFHNTIMAVCFTLWDAGWRERFEINFDEEVIFGPRAKAWYPLIRAVIQHREPDAAKILPVDPIFRTDDEVMPLQVADLFAWCFRRATDDPSFKSFEWLLAYMHNVKQTEYSQYYDLERMEEVLEESFSLARQGVPDHITQIYREIIAG